jgi:hypothetical protein
MKILQNIVLALILLALLTYGLRAKTTESKNMLFYEDSQIAFSFSKELELSAIDRGGVMTLNFAPTNLTLSYPSPFPEGEHGADLKAMIQHYKAQFPEDRFMTGEQNGRAWLKLIYEGPEEKACGDDFEFYLEGDSPEEVYFMEFLAQCPYGDFLKAEAAVDDFLNSVTFK